MGTRSIFEPFGKSPFRPLSEHTGRVRETVVLVRPVRGVHGRRVGADGGDLPEHLAPGAQGDAVWANILRVLGAVANHAESTADHLRLMLAKR